GPMVPTAKLLDHLRWPKFWERYADATTSDEERIAELRAEETTLRTRIEQSTRAFVNDPNVTPAELSTILEGLKAKLTDTQARLTELAAVVHRIRLNPAYVERQWKRLALEEKRILIRDAVSELVVAPAERARVARSIPGASDSA